ncbi:MAG: hypothetical protein B7733_05855 [Myxococcales bacterium FL481]|nr:MAG: hypothetical protein B7733_05855 [Myxococcales bacterium FL481]
MQYWHRNVEVRLGDSEPFVSSVDGDGPRVSFSTRSHNRFEPNEGMVRVFGLGADIRGAISDQFHTAEQKILDAGGTGIITPLDIYIGDRDATSSIFRAGIISVSHQYRAPGWITEIKAKESAIPFANTFLSKSLPPGHLNALNIVKALKDVVGPGADIKLGDGQQELLQVFMNTPAARKVVQHWTKTGLVLQGSYAEVLRQICEPMKIAATHQNGELHFVRFDVNSDEPPVVVSPETGLRLNGVEQLRMGRLRLKTTADPALVPGRSVSVDTGTRDEVNAGFAVSGVYRIDEVRHRGDTHGGGWESELWVRDAEAIHRTPDQVVLGF